MAIKKTTTKTKTILRKPGYSGTTLKKVRCIFFENKEEEKIKVMIDVVNC